MADDLLGDILRATTGESPAGPAASGRIGDVIARAVARPAAGQAQSGPPDLMPLAELSADDAVAFLRYLPEDQVVPLLARAPVAVAARLVGVMDHDARAWLESQNHDIEAVSEADHAAAAAKALQVLARVREGGGRNVRQASPARPVQVATSFATGMAGGSPPTPETVSSRPAEPVPTSAHGPEPPRAADPTLEILVELVDAARGRRPGELRQLADGLDHPVLAEGLRQVAAGLDPHALDAAVRAASADHLDAEARRLELFRRAVMAIRFGDRGEVLRC